MKTELDDAVNLLSDVHAVEGFTSIANEAKGAGAKTDGTDDDKRVKENPGNWRARDTNSNLKCNKA